MGKRKQVRKQQFIYINFELLNEVKPGLGDKICKLFKEKWGDGKHLSKK